MSIQDLITLLNNRLSFIQQQMQMAEARGDISQLQQLSADEASTQSTLAQLTSLA